MGDAGIPTEISPIHTAKTAANTFLFAMGVMAAIVLMMELYSHAEPNKRMPDGYLEQFRLLETPPVCNSTRPNKFARETCSQVPRPSGQPIFG